MGLLATNNLLWACTTVTLVALHHWEPQGASVLAKWFAMRQLARTVKLSSLATTNHRISLSTAKLYLMIKRIVDKAQLSRPDTLDTQ